MIDSFTLQQLHIAQAKLRPLVESKNPGSQQHEFYDTMLQTMYALDLACRETTAMRRGFEILSRRVEILERLLTIKMQSDIAEKK